MNEIQLYSVIMFFAGAALSKVVFYFEQKNRTKKFYILMSAAVLQMLDSVYTSHMATVEYAETELKRIELLEESAREEYLQKESDKVGIFMEIYTLLLIKAVPEQGRKYVNYRTWPEAKALIGQLRGVMKNGKDQG